MGQRRWNVGNNLWFTGGLIAAVAAISASWDADLHAPPRFDGAGYAILAQALGTGQGYREIDRPDPPRHAHFPPGYPAALTLIWGLTGRSDVATHVFSITCVVAATLATWQWFRWMESPRVAAWLGLALALNWTWARTAGAIQSEPLYLLLGQLALLAATWTARRGGIAAGMGLGLLLGACVLTRQIGVALAAAVGFNLLVRRRFTTLLSSGITASALVLPWVVWLAIVHENTQVELLAKAGWLARIASQVLFYVQRTPDIVTGPVVEVGTVFTLPKTIADVIPLWVSVASVVTAWALVATGVILFGWARSIRTPRRRLAGLVALFTLGLLLVWPFTEAGRFLIPLVPCLLVGGVEGLSPILRSLEKGLIRLTPSLPIRIRRPKGVAASLILFASMPYAVYALASGRSEAQRRTHDDFDAACVWIASEAKAPGPVLTRHPGEVYWLTGRQAVPAGSDVTEIGQLIDAYEVAYLLVDDERYANSSNNPLISFCGMEPSRVREVWSRVAAKSSVRVYEVVREPEDQRPGPSNVSLP
jgi:hypothetical protein